MHDAHLTLEVSMSPTVVKGQLKNESGMEIPFEGWLGLTKAVVEAVRSDCGPKVGEGPPLLGKRAGSSESDSMEGKPE